MPSASPCPFCGQPPVVEVERENSATWLVCRGAGCIGMVATSAATLSEAIRRWNQRQTATTP